MERGEDGQEYEEHHEDIDRGLYGIPVPVQDVVDHSFVWLAEVIPRYVEAKIDHAEHHGRPQVHYTEGGGHKEVIDQLHEGRRRVARGYTSCAIGSCIQRDCGPCIRN